jgi:inner membrane protein
LGVLTAFAALGSLLPDLDAAQSKAKHLSLSFRLGKERVRVAPLSFPALVLSSTLPHRGPLHSLLALWIVAALIGLPLALITSWPAAVALLFGWLSHLALDACTKTGVPLFWPDKRRVRFLPPALRVTTGSEAEGLVFALCAVAAFGLLLTQLPGVQPTSTPSW